MLNPGGISRPIARARLASRFPVFGVGQMRTLLVAAAASAALCQAAPDPGPMRSLGEAAIKNQLLDPYTAVFEWSPGPFVEVNGVTKGGGIFKRHVVVGN